MTYGCDRPAQLFVCIGYIRGEHYRCRTTCDYLDRFHGMKPPKWVFIFLALNMLSRHAISLSFDITNTA